MTWPLVLLVCMVGVLATAATEAALVRFRTDWSPRRRVFTAAFAGPVLILSPLVLVVAAMALSSGDAAGNLSVPAVVNVGLTVSLAAFVMGLLMAFLIERTFQP